MPILSKFFENTDSLCSMAWNHMFIDPSGRIKPCCRFEDSLRPDDFNLNQQTLTQAFKSDFMTDLRAKMLRNEKISGCTRCYEEESSGKKSLRQRYNSRAPYTENINLEQPQIEWVEMSTSNKCNLACVMCDSRYSSLWYDQEVKIYGKAKSLSKILTPDINHIDVDINHMRHFKFTGGEPLLDIEHVQFLKRLSTTADCSRINLNYSTNCTVVPSIELIALWKNFAFVEIALSIDSRIPAELEYIRWPANYNKIFETADFFFSLKNKMNLRLGLRPTISYLNIENIDQLFLWWNKHDDAQWFNPTHVTHPDWLSLTVLPLFKKQHIAQVLEQKILSINSELFSNSTHQLINYMFSSNSSHLISTALSHFEKLDIQRKLSFAKTYPGLFYE